MSGKEPPHDILIYGWFGPVVGTPRAFPELESHCQKLWCWDAHTPHQGLFGFVFVCFGWNLGCFCFFGWCYWRLSPPSLPESLQATSKQNMTVRLQICEANMAQTCAIRAACTMANQHGTNNSHQGWISPRSNKHSHDKTCVTETVHVTTAVVGLAEQVSREHHVEVTACSPTLVANLQVWHNKTQQTRSNPWWNENKTLQQIKHKTKTCCRNVHCNFESCFEGTMLNHLFQNIFHQ